MNSTGRWLILILCLLVSACATSQGSVKKLSNLTAKELDLRLNLAESHINNQQYQLALQELIILEPSAKNLSRYHFDLGMTYIGLDEVEKARSGFTRAVDIDYNFAEAWNNLGKVLESLNKDQEAEQAYLQAFEILTYVTPEFAAYNLGRLYMRQGRVQEAESFGRKALARNWQYLPAYQLLADAFVAQNRMEEAEAVLKSALEADLNSVSTMLALAEHQVRLGKSIEALEIFQRIVTQRPSSNEAKVAQDYLELLQ